MVFQIEAQVMMDGHLALQPQWQIQGGIKPPQISPSQILKIILFINFFLTAYVHCSGFVTVFDHDSNG